MTKLNLKNKQGSKAPNGFIKSFDPQCMPSKHDIEELAYRIHEEKGGSALDNWTEAEQTLNEKYCKGGHKRTE